MIKVLRIETEPVSAPIWEQVEVLLDRYRICQNYFYSRYSGIKSMLLVQDFRVLRDSLVKERFPLQARQWKECLNMALGTIKSMWSNLANTCISVAKENDNLSETEKKYIYYIFKAKPYWYAVVNRKQFEPNKTLSKMMEEIEPARYHYLHNLICRYTRKYKPRVSRIKEARTIMIDQGSYRFKNQEFSIMGIKPRERFSFHCVGKRIFLKGTLQVVFLRDSHRISIRYPKELNSTNEPSTFQKEIGVDKGFNKMVSCSSGNEYGMEFGKLLSQISDQMTAKNKKRNQYYSRLKELKNSSSWKDQKKYQNIVKNNLGKKKYNNQQHKWKEQIKTYINTELNNMFQKEKPSIMVKEDLSWTSRKKSYNKTMNRRLSYWTKGYLDERLTYKAEEYHAQEITVNPAYTSQICNTCKIKVTRQGAVCTCPNCGELNADVNAAKNILDRSKDTRITIYTSAKKVKELLKI